LCDIITVFVFYHMEVIHKLNTELQFLIVIYLQRLRLAVVNDYYPDYYQLACNGMTRFYANSACYIYYNMLIYFEIKKCETIVFR